MTDVFSPEKRSEVMSRVKGKNTGPELKVRRLLWRLGYRYRLHRRDLPGRPDLAFIGRRTAVFVHGCFWHGHACARGGRLPKQNADYWLAKIARNRARDADTESRLVDQGWRPLTIWECELKNESALSERLQAALGPPGQALRASPASPSEEASRHP